MGVKIARRRRFEAIIGAVSFDFGLGILNRRFGLHASEQLCSVSSRLPSLLMNIRNEKQIITASIDVPQPEAPREGMSINVSSFQPLW